MFDPRSLDPRSLPPRHHRLLLTVLAVALVCAPLYVFPYGGERATEYRYAATRVPAEEVVSDPALDAVLDCEADYVARTCVLERRVRDAGGSLRVDADGYVSARSGGHEFVVLGGAVYRTDQRLDDDGTLTLRLERTDAATALRASVPPAGERTPVVERAVAREATTTREELDADDTGLVRAGDAYFEVRETDVSAGDPP